MFRESLPSHVEVPGTSLCHAGEKRAEVHLVAWLRKKRQQVQQTKRGAHLPLRNRTRTLDGTLRPLFERGHPGLANDNESEAARADAG